MTRSNAFKWGLMASVLLHSWGFAGTISTNSLTFEECISRAIVSNLQIKDQQLEWQISKWGLQREHAAFEPEMALSARYLGNERENNVEESLSQLSPFFEERNWNYSSALEGLLPLGSQYRFGYNLSDLSNNLTNGTFEAEFEHQYSSFMGLNLTQPLLRGAGRDPILARLRLAAAQTDTDLQVLRQQVMAVVAQAGEAYWNLVFARENLNIRAESVGIAQKILADNEVRVKSGKMSELEVLQANAGVALRRTRSSTAHQEWIEAMNDLKRIFGDSSAEHILPMDKPVMAEAIHDQAASMQRAVRYNPNYLAALKAVDEENIRLKYARNQTWPQMDLEGSYGYNGLGDSASSSFEDISGGDYESWTVGVVFRVGLGGGSSAKSDLEAAKLRKRQALTRLKNAEVHVAGGINTAIARVTGLQETAKNYQVVSDYNDRLLAVELDRLAQGKSDSRKVLQIEDDVYEAKISAMQSRIDFQTAKMGLRLLEGTMMKDMGFEILPEKDDEVYFEELRDVDVNWPLSNAGASSKSPQKTVSSEDVQKQIDEVVPRKSYRRFLSGSRKTRTSDTTSAVKSTKASGVTPSDAPMKRQSDSSEKKKRADQMTAPKRPVDAAKATDAAGK